MLQLNADYPLKSRLGNGYDPCASDMLAQQHTEIGRSQGTGLVVFRQINQRKGRAGGKKQPVLRPLILDGKDQLICLRLSDFVDFPVDDGVVQFRHYI